MRLCLQFYPGKIMDGMVLKQGYDEARRKEKGLGRHTCSWYILSSLSVYLS